LGPTGGCNSFIRYDDYHVCPKKYLESVQRFGKPIDAIGNLAVILASLTTSAAIQII